MQDPEEVVKLKYLVLTSLISADNDDYDEGIKQEIIHRYGVVDIYDSMISPEIDWEYVFEPLGPDAEKYIKLMKAE